jgi:hypothetical protein
VMEGPRPMHRIARPAPTGQAVAAKATARTMPPKAPPGSKSRPMPAVARPAQPTPTPGPTTTAAGKPRPLPRLARGTASPAANRRPTEPRMALGSSGHLPAMRDPSPDITATDITAVDRAKASTRTDEEDTRVNLVSPPSSDITLDMPGEGEHEVENTMVDAKPNGVAIVAAEGASPLPRLTARLRRHSVPN